METHIQLINNNDILYRKFEGEVNFSDIYESWLYLLDNNYLVNILGVINDFRNASLHMNLDNLQELMKLFGNYKEIFSTIKLAVIMEKPENFVLPIYAELNYPDFKIKAFSAEEAAINWIK